MKFHSGDLFLAASCSSVLAASPAPMSIVRRRGRRRFFSFVLRYIRYVRREYSVSDDANSALRKYTEIGTRRSCHHISTVTTTKTDTATTEATHRRKNSTISA